MLREEEGRRWRLFDTATDFALDRRGKPGHSHEALVRSMQLWRQRPRKASSRKPRSVIIEADWVEISAADLSKGSTVPDGAAEMTSAPVACNGGNAVDGERENGHDTHSPAADTRT